MQFTGFIPNPLVVDEYGAGYTSLQDIYLKGFGKEYFFWKLCQLALASAHERQPGEGCVWGRSGYALKKCKKAVNKISSKK